MLKIIDIPAVKSVFIVPLVISIVLLYPKEQLKRFWYTQVEVRHIVYALSALLLLVVILIRSGNASTPWLMPDMPLRQFMEDLFSVRPRTKEFLFAQPLLFLGFYRRQPLFLLLGMIGQVSVINTFLHAHSFVTVSLVRSLHGMWLGLVIGAVLAAVWRFAERKTAP
jgi:hypothetical protein